MTTYKKNTQKKLFLGSAFTMTVDAILEAIQERKLGGINLVVTTFTKKINLNIINRGTKHKLSNILYNIQICITWR